MPAPPQEETKQEIKEPVEEKEKEEPEVVKNTPRGTEIDGGLNKTKWAFIIGGAAAVGAYAFMKW